MSFCLIIVSVFVKIEIPFRFYSNLCNLLYLYFCKGTKTFEKQKHKYNIPLKLTFAKAVAKEMGKKNNELSSQITHYSALKK